MFNRMVVQEAIMTSWISENIQGLRTKKPVGLQDSEISQLIHDVFGGEILKTHYKNGWHFYNRINGERYDFTMPGSGTRDHRKRFEDIPAAPDEIQNYFSQEDYSNFFSKFVSAFEDVVGLDKLKYSISS